MALALGLSMALALVFAMALALVKAVLPLGLMLTALML